MVSETLERVPLRVINNGDAGFVLTSRGLGDVVTVVTDNGKELSVAVPSDMQGKSLADSLRDYSVLNCFRDENVGFYLCDFFQGEVQLSLFQPLCIPGETWLGLIAFADDQFQPIYWHALKTWDNPVFLRGQEVEHSERIYAEPRSITGWEIRIQQPLELDCNDWILRRHLAVLVESTIAALEAGKHLDFPLRREINNLMVRQPHRVNLPYIVGLGENVY